MAHLVGATPLRRTEPWYRAKLDHDGDGIACEQATSPAPSGLSPCSPLPSSRIDLFASGGVPQEVGAWLAPRTVAGRAASCASPTSTPPVARRTARPGPSSGCSARSAGSPATISAPTEPDRRKVHPLPRAATGRLRRSSTGPGSPFAATSSPRSSLSTRCSGQPPRARSG
ncbi:excalibur calcium-binding domain-containing protein [Aquihabitans sp. G128]|nr:excalibur calcium-binding domain-containing protein [Aquihabitans sp. G128]